MSFSVVFHVRGSFVSDPRQHYKGGEVHVVHKLDEDKWSFFKATGILKDDLGLTGKLTLSWKEKETRFKDGLKRITDDKVAFEVAKYAIDNNRVVDIYVENDVQGGSGVVFRTVVGEGSGKIFSKRGKAIVDRSKTKKYSKGGASGNVAESSSGKGQKNSRGVIGKKKKNIAEEIVEEGNEDSENSDGELSDNSVGDIHFYDSEEERMVVVDDGFELPTQKSVQPVSVVTPSQYG